MKLYATMRVVLTVDDSKLNDTQGEGLEAAARDYLVEALTLYIPEADCAIVDLSLIHI